MRQLTEQEKEHARALMDLIDGLHFYSETFDLTRSLAFRDSSAHLNFRTLSTPQESEWVWNEAIAKPFRDALGRKCPRVCANYGSRFSGM